MMTIAAILLGLISVICTAHMAINWQEWPTWKRWLWLFVVIALAYATDQLAGTEDKWAGMLVALLAGYAIFFFIVSRAGAWSARLDENNRRMMEKFIKEQRKRHRA